MTFGKLYCQFIFDHLHAVFEDWQMSTWLCSPDVEVRHPSLNLFLNSCFKNKFKLLASGKYKHFFSGKYKHSWFTEVKHFLIPYLLENTNIFSPKTYLEGKELKKCFTSVNQWNQSKILHWWRNSLSEKIKFNSHGTKYRLLWVYWKWRMKSHFVREIRDAEAPNINHKIEIATGKRNLSVNWA